MLIYDENVEVGVKRSGVNMSVRFCDVKRGDELLSSPGAIVDEDAHISGDADYDGWLFYDKNGDSYFPEDFGAELKEGME